MSAADLPEEDELLAAELALGLLDETDRAHAEARLARDPAFSALYGRWRDYAAAMLGAGEEHPRPSIWSAIERGLPANDAAPAGRPASLRWWQASTAVASAAALILGAIAFRPVPPPPPAPVQRASPAMVAVLVGDKDNGAIAVSYDPGSGKLTLTPTRLAIGKRSAELWVIAAGQKPRSLGVIPVSIVDRRSPRPELARIIGRGATLAVSAEPIGGSPTGQPTGPVLYTGTISPT